MKAHPVEGKKKQNKSVPLGKKNVSIKLAKCNIRK